MKKIDEKAIEMIDSLILSLNADKVIISNLGLERLSYEAHGVLLMDNVSEYVELARSLGEVE